jgi:isoleucyl-tRNA synthetase
METFSELPAPDAALLAKWEDIRQVRDLVNKKIEDKRATGQIGASLQANIVIRCDDPVFSKLSSLGNDLKFVFITSQVALEHAKGSALSVDVSPSTDQKCERCWHYRDDVGHDPAHATLCGRCTSNLYGAGEARTVA